MRRNRVQVKQVEPAFDIDRGSPIPSPARQQRQAAGELDVEPRQQDKGVKDRARVIILDASTQELARFDELR